MVLVGLFLSLSDLSCLFFLSLQSLHDLFSFFIFIDHDIADTEVSDHNGSQTEHIISIFVDDRLIIPDGFIVSFQDKEDVSHIKLPSLMISTKFSTLPE